MDRQTMADSIFHLPHFVRRGTIKNPQCPDRFPTSIYRVNLNNWVPIFRSDTNKMYIGFCK